MDKIYFWMNVLFFIGAMCLGLLAYYRAGGYFVRDVVYVAPNLNESHLFFDVDNVMRLHEAFPDYLIIPVGRGQVNVSTSERHALADTVFTDSAYFMLHHMNFIEGGAWIGWTDKRTIVLSEALSFRLFGGFNVVGLTVFIQDLPYVITGVVRQEQQTNGVERAWMPIDVRTITALYIEANMCESKSWPIDVRTITALYIRPYDHNEVNTPIHVQQMLQGYLFSNPAYYVMVDLNYYVESINIRMRILLYMSWLILGIWLLLTERLFRTDRNPRFVIILFGVALLVFAIAGTQGILQWLPALSDESMSLFTRFTNVGLLPSEEYISYGMVRLMHLNRLANYAWIAGAITFVNIIFIKLGIWATHTTP